MSGNRQKGMTLLEILVSIAVFSVLATAIYAALDQGVSVQENLAAKRQYWQRLETVFTLIQRDLDHVVNRTPRIPGETRRTPFSGVGNERYSRSGELLRFSRSGHVSFRPGPVSPYQGIAYRFSDNTLYRRVWPRLDRPTGESGTEAALLEGINAVQVRYLDMQRNWLTEWPGLSATGNQASPLPVAVRLTIESEPYGAYERVFHVGPPR